MSNNKTFTYIQTVSTVTNHDQFHKVSVQRKIFWLNKSKWYNQAEATAAVARALMRVSALYMNIKAEMSQLAHSHENNK